MTIRKISFGFTAVLAALFFAACSEDDALTPSVPGGGDDEGLQTYTLTASVDYTIAEAGSGDAAEYAADTRATANEDDKPTRFYAQAVYGTGGSAAPSEVVEGKENADGKYEFTFQLYSGREYTYLFWADNAPTETAVPADLRNVAYTIGTVAFAAKESGTPDAVTKNITLTHAVTKVTLRSTTEAALTFSKEVSLATTCATTYNVQNLAAAASTQQTYTATLTGSSIAQNGEALSCYLIPASDEQDVTVGANLLTQSIASVPLAPDTRVTLQGDLSEDNTNWNASETYTDEKFRSYFFDENGNPKGYYFGLTYWFDNATIDDITSFILSIMKVDSFDLPDYWIRKDMTSNLYVNKYPHGSGDAYRFAFTYNGEETIFYIATLDDGDDYPDFSTIYPGS